MIVLDSNVISELMTPASSPAVTQWLAAQSGSSLYSTAITLAEIRYGIARLPDGRRKEEKRIAAEQAFALIADRLLPFDSTAAEEYATLVTARERAGRPIDKFDAQIAAICRAKGSTLATRNTKDFDDTGLTLVDPWAG